MVKSKTTKVATKTKAAKGKGTGRGTKKGATRGPYKKGKEKVNPGKIVITLTQPQPLPLLNEFPVIVHAGKVSENEIAVLRVTLDSLIPQKNSFIIPAGQASACRKLIQEEYQHCTIRVRYHKETKVYTAYRTS